MKKLKVMLSVFVFVLAASVALASSLANPFAAVVWERPIGSQDCFESVCLISAPQPCGDMLANTYHTNKNCTGSTITPKQN